ncbi:MAG: hypothetical protein K9W43_04605 [Candidatus Thorarchaeota archaeon]|nr:hypothetical protein [Candidatus Thorarchaeota archaeon]
MQIDMMTLLIGNFSLTLRVLPIVIFLATGFRSILLLSGLKRSLRTWTRNRGLSLFTILTAPGMMVTIGIRYMISTLLGVDLDGVGVDTTFGEFTPYIVTRRTPRVFVVVLSLFLTMLLSVYIGLLFLILPALYPVDLLLAIFCWYMAIAILSNSAIRGGDMVLFSSSLRQSPRSGVAELVIFVTIVCVIYFRVVGVLI